MSSGFRPGLGLRLRWPDHGSDLLSFSRGLCGKRDLADVTLTCSGGVNFSAHRLVLASASTYFSELFAGLDMWKHPVIVLKDVKASLVESVLMLVYRGEVTVPADNLDELIKLARTLGIRGLENVTIGLRDIEPAPSMSHGPSQSVEPVNEPVVMSPASSVPMPAWNRRKQQSSRGSGESSEKRARGEGSVDDDSSIVVKKEFKEGYTPEEMDEDDPEPDDGHGEDLGDVQVEEVQGMDVEPKEEDLERSISETLNELSPYDVPSQAWKEDFFSKEGADQVDQVDDQGGGDGELERISSVSGRAKLILNGYVYGIVRTRVLQASTDTWRCCSSRCRGKVRTYRTNPTWEMYVGHNHVPLPSHALDRVRLRSKLAGCIRKQGPRASVKSIIKEYLKDVPRGKRHMFSRKAIGIAIEDVKKEKAKFEKSEATRKTKRNANKRRVIRV